jgi:hypothetical protein
MLFLLGAPPQQQQPKKAAPAAPTHEPEEFEVLRTKTGITLPERTFEGDAVVTIVGWDDFEDNDVDFDYRIFKLEAAYGITDWVTAEIELPYVSVDVDPGDRESGIGDVVLEGKMSFNANRKSPAGFVPLDVAGGMRISLPTGDEDDGTGEENAVFTLFAAGSHRFERWFAGHAEVFLSLQDDERPEHGVNVAGDFTPWMPELSLLAGLNYLRIGAEFTEVSLLAGAEYRFPQPLRGMVVGGALLLGVTNDAPDWGLLLNFQLRL